MKSVDVTKQVEIANKNALAIGGHFQNEFVYEIAKLVPSDTLSITFDESLFDAKVRQAVEFFAVSKMMEFVEYNLRNTVDVHFHSTNREQRTYIKEAAKNGWLTKLDYDVLNGRYHEVDANLSDYKSAKEARNEAYISAEKKLLSYLVYLNPEETITLAVSKFLACSKYDVTVYKKDTKPTVILGKPGYSFEAEADNREIVKGEMMITDTLARFVFQV